MREWDCEWSLKVGKAGTKGEGRYLPNLIVNRCTHLGDHSRLPTDECMR